MSVQFDGSTVNQNIGYGAILSALSQKTIIVWAYLGALSPYKDILGKFHESGSPTYKGWYLDLNTSVIFGQYWSTTPGNNVQWSASAGLTVSAVNHIAVTYDWSATTNDPIMYINGTSRTVTESANAPSGAALEDATDPFEIGSLDATIPPINGTIHSVLIYNRILTAAEVADAYNSRLAIPNPYGLVFASNFIGATGGIKDGDTLSATSYIKDLTGAYTGTPANSPVFKADVYLNYK